MTQRVRNVWFPTKDSKIKTPEFNSIIAKLQKQTKSRKQVEEEKEWAKAGTRKAVSKMLKE